LTLIVTRKTGNEILMYSDARISDPSQLRSNPLKGALKLVTTNDVCIGYAGNYPVALDSIRKIRKLNLRDHGKIIETLLNAHKESNGDVDFIIATYTPALKLIRISNGSVDLDLDSAWIGDSDVFSEYQRLYHSATPAKSVAESEAQAQMYEVASKMGTAFDQLVREGKHKSVGYFTISVHSSDEGFKYQCRAVACIVPQKIPANVWTTLKFGTAQQGGYAYSVLCPQSPNIGAIGVHFFQGNVGALYHPLERDEAIVYPGVTFEQFKKTVLNNYGFQIDGVKIS